MSKNLSLFSRELRTEIDISATSANVWAALCDLKAYPIWNRFLPRAEGPLAIGKTIRIMIHPPGEAAQKYRVKIMQLVLGTRLEWRGHFIFPGLIDGHHIFEVQALEPNRVRLIQRETFTGFLVPFVWRSYLNIKLKAGFILLNEGLKAYVESQVSEPNDRSSL